MESSYHLVCYRVSGEPGIAGCSLSIGHLSQGVWTCVRKLIDCLLPCKFDFHVLKFCGWSRPRNYFNSEIFRSTVSKLRFLNEAVYTCADEMFHCLQKTTKLAKTPQPSKPMASKLAAKGSQSAPTTVSGISCSPSAQRRVLVTTQAL